MSDQPSDTKEKQNNIPGANSNSIQERSLERMEALLKQSTMGIHVLFQNADIVDALKLKNPQSEAFDFQKMKKVQDVMTELIAKHSYYEKLAYLRDLDLESYQLLIRTYFHIVENTVRASQSNNH